MLWLCLEGVASGCLPPVLVGFLYQQLPFSLVLRLLVLLLWLLVR